MEWFYARGDMQRGPVTEDELADLIKDGIISAETRVWKEGMDDWLPVSDVPELADHQLKEANGSDAKAEGQNEDVEKTREDSSGSTKVGDEVPQSPEKSESVNVPALPQSAFRTQDGMEI